MPGRRGRRNQTATDAADLQRAGGGESDAGDRSPARGGGAQILQGVPGHVSRVSPRGSLRRARAAWPWVSTVGMVPATVKEVTVALLVPRRSRWPAAAGAVPLVAHFTRRIGLPALLRAGCRPMMPGWRCTRRQCLRSWCDLCIEHRRCMPWPSGEAYGRAAGPGCRQAGLLNYAGLPDAGPAVPGRPGQPAHRADDRCDRLVRDRCSRLHYYSTPQRARRLPGRRWRLFSLDSHGVDHLLSQLVPPSLSVSSVVHPDLLRLPRVPGHLRLTREHQL